MHYRAQSCSKRALLLDVHHDVQHFDFGSGGWVCKRANDAYTSFDHVYTQYAIMSSAVTILERKVAQMETDLRRLREGHTELSGEIEMVSDSTENIQWGLTNMGGYTTFHGLTPMPMQRQQIYGLERANLIAARTMGMQRYLNVVRTQNQGIVHGGTWIRLWLKLEKKKIVSMTKQSTQGILQSLHRSP